MKYASAEDRLNPETPDGVTDTTLGGYPRVHGRAPAFEGCDGEPYTVAVETDQSGDPEAPFAAYLVFVRWSRSGTAVMGHLETEDLAAAAIEEEARAALEALPLTEVRLILDEAIRRKAREAAEEAASRYDDADDDEDGEYQSAEDEHRSAEDDDEWPDAGRAR